MKRKFNKIPKLHVKKGDTVKVLSGNDKKIEDWRHDQAIKRTHERRPDLYEKLTDKDNKN